ncbi:PEP-CTERM sorting domain-containing protein [Duganella sp. FT92W]|uniref:PEP-CTERM sorting domain-containing protein n=1 Tax=Pseudoduganella rivuli TaxID=2666085 RepID=A0A7X2LQD9_9BURK|nr:PEP-CTERM sorting domain-containing protein [Pseudoduganella rivuli]MRV71235.1 PEP-CTERM sorting domain-containing protein [Pseudoduganella rivuli]
MHIATLLKTPLAAALLCAAAQASAGTVATFDDLPLQPAIDLGTGIQYTNATNSLDYVGVTWDARFSVFGDQYRVGGPSGPTFGIAHSGHYFVTNQDGGSGLTITTNQVLTGAWFGRNQYYGFGEGGADQVTIVALAGGTELASVVFNLPDSHPGLAEPLSFVDTSSFAALSGITGYRIDRRELGTLSGHWVADDFQFEPVSNVPEPSTWAMLAAGLGLLGWRSRRRT